MESLYQFSEIQMLAFFLVLIRLSGFIVTWPVFGVALVPNTAKVLFSLGLAFLIFPAIDYSAITVDLASNNIIWLGIRELFIGVMFGFVAKMFFFAINMSGHIISLSMGLSSGELFNPAFNDQMNAIDQFQITIATLFFLAINGHHLFIAGVVDSFRVLPLSMRGVDLTALAQVSKFAQEIITIGVKLSAPVLISILFVNIGMAVVGRAVPQINVLITSLPVNILVGFFVILICIPLLIWQMNGLLELTTTRLFQLVKAL